MNKKLLALAIAAALVPAAAMADSGNVKISGVMHVSVDSLNGNSSLTGTDNDSQINVSSNSSKIVFGGNEALGNGLKAIWEVTSYVRLDESSSTLGNGNTFAGLSGGFGTAILGKHDTPVKILGRKVDLFGDQIGDSRNLISSADGVNAMWDQRPGNVIAYISPTVSGFHGAIAYVSNLNVTAFNATTEAVSANSVGATQEESVTALSALGIYESGPVMVGLGYERHNLSNVRNLSITNDTGSDLCTAPSTSCTIANPEMQDEKIWRLIGGYSFGDFKVTGLYQKVSDVTGWDGIGRKTWGLGGAYKMGATTLKAQYYKTNDMTGCDGGCDDTGANMIAVGADYSLSKRTTAYVAYAKTNNDTNAAFSAFGGGHGDNPGTVTGKDPSGFSLGMKHSF